MTTAFVMLSGAENREAIFRGVEASLPASRMSVGSFDCVNRFACRETISFAQDDKTLGQCERYSVR